MPTCKIVSVHVKLAVESAHNFLDRKIQFPIFLGIFGYFHHFLMTNLMLSHLLRINLNQKWNLRTMSLKLMAWFDYFQTDCLIELIEQLTLIFGPDYGHLLIPELKFIRINFCTIILVASFFMFVLLRTQQLFIQNLLK